MARCMQCGKCKQCLSKHLGVTPELIDEKIEQFKRQGCTLFV